MNEEQLIEFVNWLPSVVPEFKDATPDQIVQALNQMSESDEGQQILSQLINTFQQAKQSADSQMFKKGGKLAAFVSKYGKGGEMCCKKKAILQGGMVNKVAEKMQDGGKTRLDKKLNEVLRTEGDKISYQNVPEGVFSQESWKWKNLRRDALGTGRNPVGSFSRVIINAGTPKADTTYTFMPLTDPRDYVDTDADFITVSRKNAEDVAKYSDFLNNFDAIVDKYSTPEKMQDGGELVTNTSANTLSNLGLLPKAQNGLSIQPQVKPSGIRGWFWKPTYQPRVDASGYEGDTEWTGERATYYKPNGDLIQILTKNYKPGNGAITERTIRNPFTPIADTTTVVSNQYGNREVPTGQFNEVFRRNFDKKSK